eukprot:gene8244-11158_t
MNAIEVPFDCELDILAQMIQAELGIPFNQQHLEIEGQYLPLNTAGKLFELGLVDGQLILVKQVAPQQALSRPTPSQNNDNNLSAESLIAASQADPNFIKRLRFSDPELADCLSRGNITDIRGLIMKRLMGHHRVKYEEQKDREALLADPDNPELQKKLQEKIRLENIEESFRIAMENMPETFARVTMLYVNIDINGYPIKAFVDSGAQSTIMSLKLAEQCNIARLIDEKFKGEARGVGTAKICGRIHIAQMKFGQSFFNVSLTVLETSDVDFLLGLDMLKRYRGIIDLGRNSLRLDIGQNSFEEVQFLGESDLPDNAKGTTLSELSNENNGK